MTRKVFFLAGILLVGLLLGSCSSENLPRTIYTADESRADESGIRLHKMVLLSEDDDFVQLEVDYEYVGSAPAGQIKLFIMPNHEFWSERAIEVKPGRNAARMSIGLSRRNMEDKKVTRSTTTQLNVSFDHYTPEKYLGSVHRETVPFRKEWKLPDQS